MKKKGKMVLLFSGKYKPKVRTEGETLAYVQTQFWRCIVPSVPGIGNNRVRLWAEIVKGKK